MPLYPRLYFSGLLLFAGLSMAVNPAGFLALTDGMAGLLRKFEHRLQGQPWYEPEPAPRPAVSRTAVRCAGLVLSVLALALFATALGGLQ